MSRLVEYYERKKDAKALQLSEIRSRIRRAEADLQDFHSRYAEANASRCDSSRNAVDIRFVRLIEDYKELLRFDIDRKKLEIETLEREADICAREATDAHKEHKTWDRVKEKRETAVSDKQRVHAQHELDDLAVQQQQRVRRAH
jgi:flagellar export protein FliJ